MCQAFFDQRVAVLGEPLEVILQSVTFGQGLCSLQMCEIDLYHQGAPSLVRRLTYFDAAFVAWKRSYIEPKLDTFPRQSYFHLWEAESVSLYFNITALDVFEGAYWVVFSIFPSR